MIGAHPLIIVRRVHNLHFSSGPLFIGAHRVNHGGRQLEIDVIEVHHIRMHILKHSAHPTLRLNGIDNFERIEQFLQLSRMEIHIGRVAVDPVSHDTPLMFHPEILYLMSSFL